MSNIDWTASVLNALNASPVCDANASCVSARIQLQRLDIARIDGTFDRITNLARQLQLTKGMDTLDSTVTTLRTALSSASNAMYSLGLNDSGDCRPA